LIPSPGIAADPRDAVFDQALEQKVRRQVPDRSPTSSCLDRQPVALFGDAYTPERSSVRSDQVGPDARTQMIRPSDAAERLSPVIGKELRRLFTVAERHRRLLARLLIAFALTLLVDIAGSVLIWVFESGTKGGDIHGFGDAAFFTTVQLLTVSSQIKNPLTTAGKLIDLALETWAIFVVTTVAGSFASFFSSGDSS
jgi:hypothetical protein